VWVVGIAVDSPKSRIMFSDESLAARLCSAPRNLARQPVQLSKPKQHGFGHETYIAIANTI